MEERRQYIDRLMLAFVSMRKGIVQQQSDNSCWLPHGQSEAFMLIDHAGQVSVGNLAQQLSVTSGAVTQLIDPLVKLGYVQRIPDSKDRRTINLSLTKSGLQFKASLKAAKQERITEVLSVLSDNELRQVTTLIEKISASQTRIVEQKGLDGTN